MRVLHLDSGREMRGGQWQALYLMVGQKTIGWEPLLLAPVDSPLFAEARKRGVSTGALTLWGVAKHSKMVDITHAHDARSHTVAALTAKGRFVVSRRVAFPLRTGWLSKWKYSKPRRFLAISAFVARQLRDYGIAEERIGIVYDGVPVEPAAASHGDRLIAPAWSDPRKCAALGAEAARLAGVPLVISANLEQDLPSARALLYLSEMEGLGSAALLAMSRGVPVIASKVGGLPEIVLPEQTGLLVNNEVNEVARAIGRLMNDTELARRLGNSARDKVRSGFTLADMALRTVREYKQALA
ncbi:MAG: glycosyltransferase family 4 protein [Bryobacterales bacterium]|nr:glycosyltransferase family 4 protein [Bryobacterales bacterium]